jgi:hypothetical protein
MIGGAAFRLLKMGKTGAESWKQAETCLAGFAQILSKWSAAKAAEKVENTPDLHSKVESGQSFPGYS